MVADSMPLAAIFMTVLVTTLICSRTILMTGPDASPPPVYLWLYATKKVFPDVTRKSS